MAEIIQEEKGGGKKKAKKLAPHIDMTPMVDLMCLLITFFMLTTAFSKAKVMEIVLPEKLTKGEPPRIPGSRTLNIILGPDNKIFTYPGSVKPEEFNNIPPILPPLQETDFSATGIRQLLLERNRTLARKIQDFKDQVLTGKIVLNPDSVQGTIRRMKNVDDTGPIVLIKAYKKANYGNFVDILDEMNICGIARYTFVDIAWYEEKMVESAAGITPEAAKASSN
ncbi:MAG: biopolymer transporter ExbD [Bacteroidales bacterium]|nr:biopolymer transporter ExbD [Bacteroidales bacterium]